MLGRVLPSLSLENLVSAWDGGVWADSAEPRAARGPRLLPCCPLMADLCPSQGLTTATTTLTAMRASGARLTP